MRLSHWNLVDSLGSETRPTQMEPKWPTLNDPIGCAHVAFSIIIDLGTYT